MADGWGTKLFFPKISKMLLFSQFSTLLALVCFGQYALAWTNQDFILLRDAIKEFIQTNPGGPDRNIPLLVRASFHDVATFNPSKGFGSLGCLLVSHQFAIAPGMRGLDEILTMLTYTIYDKFRDKGFTTGDILLLAGKVAIEMANPCLKID